MMDKKAMTWKEVIAALLAAFIIFFLISTYGTPIFGVLKDIGQQLNWIEPDLTPHDTYEVCDAARTVQVYVDEPILENKNEAFTYAWIANELVFETEFILLRFSSEIDDMQLKDLVTVYKDNTMGKPSGEDEWEEADVKLNWRYGIGSGGKRAEISEFPNGYLLIVLDDSEVSNGKRICKSQRQLSLKVDN
jgi:hypothetical protein